MQRPHPFIRILAFIFSATVAYFLWTYLRPRFVTPVSTQSTEQVTDDVQPVIALINAEPAILPTTKADVAVAETQTKPTSNKTQTPDVTVTTQKLLIPDNSLEPKADLKKTAATQQTTKTAQNGVTATAAPKLTKSLPANRTITVINGIEKKMLGYKKFGTHYPTAFKITVGSTVVEQGNTIKAPVKDNTLVVRYDFEFMNGYRNGAREVTIGLKPDTDAITLAFNWKQEYHLAIAETDRVISMIEKDVPYQA